MTNLELQALVETTSEAYFNRPFEHRATFNARLRTTGGRFNLNTQNLDFNPSMFAAVTAAVRLGIIKHELVHYHLYRAHRGYRHRDADFKALLAAVGGSRYAPRVAPITAKYRYVCTQCGQEYLRTRRINLRKYGCGRCHGRLRLVSAASKMI